MAEMVSAYRASLPPEEATRIVIRPEPVGGRAEYEVKSLGGNTYLITGDKPLRWLRQTDFTNDEAVGFLADRLARLGVEDRLAKAGPEAGANGIIGTAEDS